MPIDLSIPHQVIQGDCLEVLKSLPDGCVDAVVTDPPYGVGLGGTKGSAHNGSGGHGLVREAYSGFVDSYDNFVGLIVPRINAAIACAKRAGVFTGPHIHEQVKPDAIGGIYCPASAGRHGWGFKNLLPVLLYGNAPDLSSGATVPTAIQSAETAHRRRRAAFREAQGTRPRAGVREVTRRLALIPYAFAESVKPENPLGFRPRILERGWEAFYSERESSDSPCVDDCLAAGWGVYGSRVAGCFGPNENTLCIGHYHDAFGGAPLFPEPRGPGAFTGGQFHDLEGFIAATRKRTDLARKRGLDFGAYMTLPRWDALDGQGLGHQARTLQTWTRTIKEAGFTRVGGDMAPGTAQKPGAETAGLRWAEHLVYEGIDFDGETFERCTPTAFAWANGRFGVIASPENRERREGWIGELTEGCYTRKFLWLQGHIPPDKRREMVEAETRMDVIVDCAGTGLIPMSAPSP